jgi:hypothetical protein
MRWVARDDIGCTEESSPDYNPVATISAPPEFPGNCAGGCMDPLAVNFDPFAVADEGSCEYTGIGDYTNSDPLDGIQISNSGITVPVRAGGEHSVIISDVKGKTVYEAKGKEASEYTVKDLTSGSYVLNIEINGVITTKAFTIK